MFYNMVEFLYAISGTTNSNMTDDDWANLNTSEHDFPNDLWYIKSTKEVAVKTSLMVPVGVVGIFLNYVILLMLCRNRWLWSPSNMLVANLALVDLVTLLFCPWLMLARDFYQNYVLGAFGCRFEGFLQVTCLLSAVGAIMLVSYDRLAAATMTSEARITKRVAPKLILLSWCLAAALSIPWIVFRNYTERQWLNFLETFCAEDMRIIGVYWHVLVTIMVWAPLGLMTLTYGVILWRLARSAKDLSSRGGGHFIVRARGRAMRITACVLVMSTVCRVPYTALIYWQNDLIRRRQINAVEGPFSMMWFAANYLMYLNCAINPLIYGFTNGRYRRAMDRTPGIAWFRFGSWCCVCSSCKSKPNETSAKNEKIFVIQDSPKPNKKLSRVIKNMLHIHKETIEFSIPNADELTNKPTKVTPLKTDNA